MIRVYPPSTPTVDSQLATLKFLVILEKESNLLWIFQSSWVKLIHMGFFEQIVFTIIILLFMETDIKNASKSFSVQQLVKN